ncbi:MAG: class I SAM-dependent methyltransferase [Candidatus Woesearchaeota archaeon]
MTPNHSKTDCVIYEGAVLSHAFTQEKDWMMNKKKIFKIIRKNLKLKKGDKILEIGCNRGSYVRELQKGYEVYGIDVNEAAIKEGMANNLSVMSATKTDFPDCHFDKVYSSHVIEHIQDTNGLLKEIHRVLKPGGLFVFVYPFEVFRGMAALRTSIKVFKNIFLANRIHVHKFTPSRIRKEIAGIGFEYIDSKFFFANTPQYITVLRKNEDG